MVEKERREAIDLDMDWAAPGDVVILCGKGHETYQEIGSKTLPLDEREVVRSLL